MANGVKSATLARAPQSLLGIRGLSSWAKKASSEQAFGHAKKPSRWLKVVSAISAKACCFTPRYMIFCSSENWQGGSPKLGVCHGTRV